MQGIFSQNLWLVPLYTLSGMALSSLWSPNIIKQAGGPRPAGYFNILMTLLAFSHALLAFPETVKQGAQYLSFGWLDAPGLHITLDLEISSLTVGALILVTGLNLVAQIYAIGYLEMEIGRAHV